MFGGDSVGGQVAKRLVGVHRRAALSNGRGCHPTAGTADSALLRAARSRTASRATAAAMVQRLETEVRSRWISRRSLRAAGSVTSGLPPRSTSYSHAQSSIGSTRARGGNGVRSSGVEMCGIVIATPGAGWIDQDHCRSQSLLDAPGARPSFRATTCRPRRTSGVCHFIAGPWSPLIGTLQENHFDSLPLSASQRRFVSEALPLPSIACSARKGNHETLSAASCVRGSWRRQCRRRHRPPGRCRFRTSRRRSYPATGRGRPLNRSAGERAVSGKIRTIA